jgi:hypothetical protein
VQKLTRRSLVVAALMFWQGGFTFYASVVVPVGRDVLGSHLDQGFITRRVTNYLNLAGAVALVPLAWDAAAEPGRLRWRLARWLCWIAMAATLVWLAWQHGQMDALLDPDAGRILDRPEFKRGHRWYLHTSSLQWGAALVFVVLSLLVWRDEDRAEGRI